MEIGIVDEYFKKGISRWSSSKGDGSSLAWEFKYVDDIASYFLMPTRF
jgi:hypothetical protein